MCFGYAEDVPNSFQRCSLEFHWHNQDAFNERAGYVLGAVCGEGWMDVSEASNVETNRFG